MTEKEKLTFGNDWGAKMPRMKSAFTDDWGGPVKGVIRVISFFALIIFMTPIQLISMRFEKFDRLILPKIFQHLLIGILGFKVRVHGKLATQKPVLYVSNHSSYLDIPVLGSVIPAAFVAKSEVANWPLIGWLAKIQNTAFVVRRSTRAKEQRDVLRERILNRESLILFPEGTSSDGQTVLNFKSSLFSLAETELSDGTPVYVQPITTICTAIAGIPLGRIWRPYYAWYGDMGLGPHLWNVFCLGHFTVDVILHEPVTIKQFKDRKEMAEHCQNAVTGGLNMCLTGRFSGQNPAQPAQKQLAPKPSDLPQQSH